MLAIRNVLFALIIILGAIPAAADSPSRIVSLAPSITKNLCLLGVGDRIIGATVYCPDLAGTEKIGTVLEPNIEKIVSLAPDLVIATREGNNIQSVRRLQSLGIRVAVMGSVNSFNDICDDFKALGKLVGREQAARTIIDRAGRRVARVERLLRGKKPMTVFWEVGAQPLFTVSKTSFVNDFIERAGGKNIFGDLSARYPQVSREAVVARDPGVIVLVTMGDVTAQEKSAWSGYRQLAAARTGRIYVLSDSSFTDPTPEAIAHGIELMANLLHGITVEGK